VVQVCDTAVYALFYPVAAKLVVADKRIWDCNNFNRILILLPFLLPFG
jgi:hypothetical protein